MSGYTKVFSSLLDSTVWCENKETRLVWITMLLMKDRNQVVVASVPGLAKRAGVELAECEAALERLSSPDKYSTTKDHEGRRIAAVDGGWVVHNGAKYRDMLSAEERRAYKREKQAEYRQKKKKPPTLRPTAKELAFEAALARGDMATADKLTEPRKDMGDGDVLEQA